jgi:hypothetical protein
MRLPRLVEIEQKLYAKRVGDLAAAVHRAWDQSGCRRRIRKGDRVGVAVGSRGIDSIAAIVSRLAELIRGAGARPFLLPAMGSHGGATSEGQTAVLASLGMTPASVGAPVRASMATVRLGQTSNGLPVYTAREATRSDGIVVVNRVKQHTDFSGPYESGLVKMLAIGLGKREGAAAMHSQGCRSLREDVPSAARLVLQRVPILAGIAVLENGHHQTAELIGLSPDRILSEEKLLLRRARRTAARLPFPSIDILLVDWIGKDVSGVGFDTHVLGRRMIWGEPEFRGSNIGIVAALDLTPGSHGNALGVGLADLATERLARKIDWSVVRTNVLHTGFLNRAKRLLTLPNDRELMSAALTALGDPDPRAVRLVRIADTLQLGRMWVSEGLLEEARRHPRVTVVGRLSHLRFDRSGNLKRLERGDGALG